MGDKVFISYSRVDYAQVIAIKQEIDSLLSINCWMDLDGIESGEEHFENVIINAINKHSIMLFMLSDNSMNSEYAMKELRYAKAKNKRIILINLGCPNGMNDEFIFNFTDADIIEYTNDLQYRKFIKHLAQWCDCDSIDIRAIKRANNKSPNILAIFLYFTLYILTSYICCSLGIDSLRRTLDFSSSHLWPIIISYMILCSIGYSYLSYSIAARNVTKNVISKFLTGFCLIAVFGALLIVPCQTHTLYYRYQIDKSLYEDIADVKNYIIEENLYTVSLDKIRDLEIQLQQRELNTFSHDDVNYINSIITNMYGDKLAGYTLNECNEEVRYYDLNGTTRISTLSNLFNVWQSQWKKGFNTEFILFIFVSILLNILAFEIFNKLYKSISTHPTLAPRIISKKLLMHLF